jgi:hypothetical protein
MIVDKGGGPAFKEKGEVARVFESEPGKWPKDANTQLVRVSIMDADYSGVAEPTEAPEPPEGDMILDLNTSGLTPGKHWVKTSLFVVDDEEGEQESEPSGESEVTVTMGDGIRVRRPKWHNLADNEDASETDLEDYNKPLFWDLGKPFPTGVKVWTAKQGGVKYEDNSNATGTYQAVRGPVATLKDDIDKYMVRFNINLGRHTQGALRAVLEQYDMVAGVPQLVGADLLQSWSNYVDDETFEFKVSKNTADTKNKTMLHIHPNTKELRVRFEGRGNTNLGVRNFDAEITQYGVFAGWAPPSKSKRLEAKRGETPEPKDTVYPHGGYCKIVDKPKMRPFKKNYATHYSTGFEDATKYLDWNENSAGGTQGGRTQVAAIHDNWGYRAAKITQGGNGHRHITYTLATAQANLVLSTDFFVQTLNSTGAVGMLWLRNTDGTTIARLGVNSNNKMQLQVTNNVGSTSTYVSSRMLEPGDLGQMEIQATGVGTAAGRVRAWLSIGKGRRINIFDVEGINLTGRLVKSARLGGDDTGSNVNALWDFYYDETLITDLTLQNKEYEPGNVIEYYGPHKTPKHSEYGPYGVRVPVRGGGTYSVGVNIASDDASGNTKVMRWRARSANHRILETFGYVASFSGDTKWTRYTQTFTVPANTAYIEWFENDMGQGTVWIHGIQIEKGATATAYTDKNALTGSLSVFFSTAPQGITATDPMRALGEVKKIRDIEAVITDDDLTSFYVDFRSGNTLNTLGNYTTDVSALNKDHAFIEVRVTLTSTSDTHSPELRRIEIDLDRPHSHLLREDGTEFAGGVLVNNVQAESPQHNVERVQFASGAVGDHTWGTKVLRRVTIDAIAFRPQTPAEIAEIYGNGFVRLQTPYGRQTLRLEELPSFETNPQTRLYLDAQRMEYFQVYTTTITGIIEAEEVF